MDRHRLSRSHARRRRCVYMPEVGFIVMLRWRKIRMACRMLTRTHHDGLAITVRSGCLFLSRNNVRCIACEVFRRRFARLIHCGLRPGRAIL